MKDFFFFTLSHSYERMVGLYFPILIGAKFIFAAANEKILSEIKEVKPTILLRQDYTKIYLKIRSQINKKIF